MDVDPPVGVSFGEGLGSTTTMAGQGKILRILR